MGTLDACVYMCAAYVYAHKKRQEDMAVVTVPILYHFYFTFIFVFYCYFLFFVVVFYYSLYSPLTVRAIEVCLTFFGKKCLTISQLGGKKIKLSRKTNPF